MKLSLVTLLLLSIFLSISLSACQKQSLDLANVEPVQDAPEYTTPVKLAP